MNKLDADTLIEKYRSGTCSPEEREIIENYILQVGVKPVKPEDLEQMSTALQDRVYGIIKTSLLWPRMISSVAALLLLAIGVWWFMAESNESNKQTYANTISPGTNKATLTLPNGKSINLNNSESTVIYSDGRPTYRDNSQIDQNATGYLSGTQKLTTPKGGEYKLILDDGTKVWLNASSTIAFPSKFSNGSPRNVKISGEVYFEVAKDNARPFVISVSNQTITVLGTQFNVNAYDNQTLSTTLVEGSVRLNSKTILKPGETAQSTPSDTKVSQVDVSLITAWKNGKIQFEDADLRTVMAMLIRWYDIDVGYSFYPKDARFSGSISRHKNISEVLKLLESTQEVHFKIEGRRVIVEE